jgi:hypothetical protein
VCSVDKLYLFVAHGLGKIKNIWHLTYMIRMMTLLGFCSLHALTCNYISKQDSLFKEFKFTRLLFQFANIAVQYAYSINNIFMNEDETMRLM